VTLLTVLATWSALHWAGAATALGAAMVAAARPPNRMPALAPAILRRTVVLLEFMIVLRIAN
jgi:hypothetical protein